METTYRDQMNRLRDAVTLRNLIDKERIEAGEQDSPLLFSLDGYIMDLKHRLGIINCYLDELQRIAVVKDVMRSLDPVFDEMTTLAGDKPLEGPGLNLWTYLVGITLDLGWVINTLEARHPRQATFFKEEREWYAETRK